MSTTTAIDIIPSGAALGAEVRGVDLAHLTDDEFAAISQAWAKHLVLLFRDQKISDDEHVAFSRRFGQLDQAAPNQLGRPFIADQPHMSVISNLIEDGTPLGQLGNAEAIWHTDMSYTEVPPMAAILRALEIPEDGGGDTWFANMYLAWDRMPADLKSRIQGLTVLHDASRDSAGDQRKGQPVVTDPRKAPGARHPIARVHPVTGRTALFLGRRRNAYLVGLAFAESEELLDRLWQHAGQKKFAWVHKWRVDDVIMWDNRCVIHRRDGFDAAQRRLMHRTQIRG